MSVQFTFEQDVDTVFDTVTQTAFLIQRSIEQGEPEPTCHIEQHSDGIVINLRRTVTRELPAFLSKIFDSTQTINMTETWKKDGQGWSGQSIADIEGQPVEVNAKFSLMPSAEGAVYSITHTAKAKVPLVGGKIEKYILSNVDDEVIKELEYVQQMLSRKQPIDAT